MLPVDTPGVPARFSGSCQRYMASPKGAAYLKQGKPVSRVGTRDYPSCFSLAALS
jgi:hypothetical protein